MATTRKLRKITADDVVQIPDEDLGAVGLLRVGATYGDNPGAWLEALLDALERYHSDNHRHGWRFCEQRPCRDLPDGTR